MHTQNTSGSTRREFLKSTAAAGAAAAAAGFTPYFLTAARAQEASKNDRHAVGFIGTGDRLPGALTPPARQLINVLAVCDVDKKHLENGNKLAESISGHPADMYEDYRKVLDRKDIDAVIITTPDHWHSKIAIEAMQAGKDVYCEKPLTLTIDEGKKICQVQKQTNRVFQVGTQQRSEFNARTRKTDTTPEKNYNQQFLQAVALAHAGKLGKIKKVTCSIGACAPSETIPKVDVPTELNWDMWLGQAPMTDYVQGGKSPSNPKYPTSRTHYEFRWWYEYSGGKLTDWGAHHVDIAQWAIGMDKSGPKSVEVVSVDLPVPFEKGRPTVSDRYNTAHTFNVKFMFPNDVELIVRDGPGNGIWIQGDKAEIFVSREALRDIQGTVIAELDSTPVAEEDLIKLCKGKKPGNHMRNFFECVRDRSTPISDVFTHHRAITTCHLANIAIRLNRPLKWDADKEEIVGDSEANGWVAREQRKGYEIKV
jgi:predicted dehydrogenase